MPDDKIKISALPSALTLNNTDEMPIVQDNGGTKTTKKALVQALGSHIAETMLFSSSLNTEAKSIIGAINEVDGDISDINGILDGYSYSNFIEDKNIDSGGSIINANGFCVSEKITYNWTGQRRYYCGENLAQYSCFVAFYASDDTLLGRFGVPSSNGGSYRTLNAETQLEETPSYVRFSFTKNYIGKITENTNTNPTIYWNANKITQEGIIDRIDEIEPIIRQTKTLLGNDSITSESASLSANTTLELTDAPWFIKKKEGITARMYFSSFTSVSIGKGFEKYRGKWIVIDGTNITPYSSDGETSTPGTAIPHGLTISDYLMIAAYMGNDGKCQIALNTTSGTFSTTIDYSYEWNYAPFLFGSQAMTNVKLSYSCSDLRCPLWIIGDSYMGMGAERIGGQLKNLGFINYCIDAIAGGKAIDSGTSHKSMYDDLLRMLAISTPRFIIWAIGMNGGNDDNIAFLPTLIDLCEDESIELILYMPPCVPTRNKTDLNTYIRSTGLRYINGYEAVGSTAQGVWYTGFLSSDEVHPTQLGAKALAERYLADCPELVQYGKTVDVDLSNYYTKSEDDALLLTKADKSNTYTKAQVDEIINSILPTDTTEKGATANFKTSYAKPISFTAYVEAQQDSGIPTPSNSKPITGTSVFNIDINNNTTIINLGGTYYGGRVIQNKTGNRAFLVTHESFTIDSNLLPSAQWFSNLYQIYFSNALENAPAKYNVSQITFLCDKLLAVANDGRSTHKGNFITLITSGLGVALSIPDCETQEQAEEFIQNNSVFFVYELAEPYTINLSDGTPINAVIGDNTASIDVGEIDVSYKCSVEEYVNNHTSNNRSLGGSLSKGAGDGEDPEELDEKTLIDDEEESGEIKPISKK